MKRLPPTGYYLQTAARISLWMFFVLLAYMPLHILLSTWIGSSLGILEFAKIFKDIVLFAGFLLIFLLSVHKPWFKEFMRDRLVWLVASYALLTIVFALIKSTDQDAEILAVVYNLRFFVFFLYAALLARYFKVEWLIRRSLQVVLGVGAAVLMFGFIQYMWLPDTALSHIGYSRENGVLPAFFIDDKPDLERIMSTLRDPNSYGSYILILLSIALVWLLKHKNRDLKRILAGIAALCALNLYFTFSRSAWIGALLTLFVIGFLHLKTKQKTAPKQKSFRLTRTGIAVIVAVTLLVGGIWLARDSYFVKNVIFHADESTVLEDPNQLRWRFLQESMDAVAENPVGYGPGTAGLASIRNEQQGTVLNENYYFQILYEVGVLGFGLFMSILVVVAVRLYKVAHVSTLAIALLAAFAGLAFTNLLVHIWSNEAVAYTWWGLAGLLVFQSWNSRRTRVRQN